MRSQSKHIIVFEHDSLIFDLKNETEQNLHQSLVQFFGKGVPYFNLIRNGVKFNEFVGAIQIGDTLINVLPKADKRKTDDLKKLKWNRALIDMLRAVNGFEVKAPSSTDLNLKKNSVLDLYFELFVSEVEYLLHRGLVKKYRKAEGDLTTLKGQLLFTQQISNNLIHKERFYTRYTTYDPEHLLHIILFQTILVLKKINTNAAISGRINALLLNFPEMPNEKISETVFDKIGLNRKTRSYKKAVDISRLILLHYHPDLSKGKNDVLALMFDMNLLWEQFVLVSLKKKKGLKVKGQNAKYFWKPYGGNRRTIRPDITLKFEGNEYVIDAKWKLVEKRPSIEDIRQMYAYHHYYNAKKVALLYPGKSTYISGNFVLPKEQTELANLECGLMFTQFEGSVKHWQSKIAERVIDWMKA